MRVAKKKTRSKKALPKSSADTPQLEALWLVLKSAQFSAQSKTAQKLVEEAGMPSAQITWLRTPPSDGAEERELLLVVPKRLDVSNARGWEAARALRQSKEVLDAEPLFRTSGLEPAPGALAEQERKLVAKSGGGDKPLLCAEKDSIWHLGEINATKAWLLLPPQGGQRCGKGIVIGHPDTGYTKHYEIWPEDGSPPQIKPSLGYNFEEGKADPTDLMTGKSPGHGTATASVIISRPGGPDPMFVTGVAYEADLVPFRVSDSVIHISFKNLIQAIYRAVDSAGVHVISMSLGGPVKAKALEAAISYAISRGVIVVAAAGNHYPFTVYPAGYSNVVALAATNCQHKPWSGSTKGEQVDLCAPGESVWRAHSFMKAKLMKAEVADSSGSSYATAITAGAAATWLAFWGRDFLVARYGAGRLQEVFASLLKSHGHTTPSGWDKKNYGAGILDLRLLLEAPLPPPAKVKKKAASNGGPDIAHYFPQIASGRVDAEIARIIGTKPSPKAKQGPATVDLEEFAFHVATNPELRDALHKRMSGPVAKAAPDAASRAKVAALLNDASATLAARIMGE